MVVFYVCVKRCLFAYGGLFSVVCWVVALIWWILWLLALCFGLFALWCVCFNWFIVFVCYSFPIAV